jgi:3-hydroxyacyl-CoA dehydrogenase
MSRRSKAAIIGTGLIGRGWATAFARAGWEVALWDATAASAAGALDAIRDALQDLAAAGLVADPAAAFSAVGIAPTLAAAVGGADYIQESVPESVDAKRSIFEAIDAAAPSEAIAGSSTSTIAGSRFLADVPGRARCIVAHPANPPHLMPVVEVVPSPWHDGGTVERACSILASIGQVPVVVRKEVEGFVMNRLQAAVVNEAMALVANGVIEPADLDAVMKHSLGLRWAFMGPFETMDLNAPNGFLDYATRYGHLYERMGRDLTVAAAWSPDAIQRIEASRRAATPQTEVAQRMRWRDRALMRLLALKNSLERNG